jgi:hypothetical protein
MFNKELVYLVLIFPIYLIFKSEDRKFVDTICGIRRSFIKASLTRYSAHHRLDAERPALLLEVVAQLKILLVAIFIPYKKLSFSDFFDSIIIILMETAIRCLDYQ